MKEPSDVHLHGGRDEYGPYLGCLYLNRIAPCGDAACQMNDSVGKCALLGPVESDDAQTVSVLPHTDSKKAVYRHVLWERSPLFGFPNRVMNVASTAFGEQKSHAHPASHTSTLV
jgi:hypothetical protein